MRAWYAPLVNGRVVEDRVLCSQSSFVGAIAISDLVKSTLGPKGMVRLDPVRRLQHAQLRLWCGLQDKILQPMSQGQSKVTFTNDGATILRSIPIDNPSAKILVGALVLLWQCAVFSLAIFRSCSRRCVEDAG